MLACKGRGNGDVEYDDRYQPTPFLCSVPFVQCNKECENNVGETDDLESQTSSFRIVLIGCCTKGDNREGDVVDDVGDGGNGGNGEYEPIEELIVDIKFANGNI